MIHKAMKPNIVIHKTHYYLRKQGNVTLKNKQIFDAIEHFTDNDQKPQQRKQTISSNQYIYYMNLFKGTSCYQGTTPTPRKNEEKRRDWRSF